jgi:Ricin-type beta-trefoil lectin domain-like
MKPFLAPLRPFLVLGLAVSLFPMLALAQLFYPNVRYRIRSVLAADKVLDVKGGPAAVDNGVRMQLYQLWGGKNQNWFIEKQPDGTYVIRSGSSSLVLDVQGGSDAKNNGDRIQQWQFQGTPNQTWRIVPVDPRIPGSPYKIISVQSNKVIDAQDGMNATKDGTELQQWDGNDASNQDLWASETARFLSRICNIHLSKQHQDKDTNNAQHQR